MMSSQNSGCSAKAPESQVLAYKRNAQDVAERLSMLWERRGKDRIFAHMEAPTRALNDFRSRHKDGETTYPDPHERIGFWDKHWAELTDLEDDWMPIAYLSEFDQGVYAAALGAPIEYMTDADTGWISSMCPPVLQDIDEVDRLKIDPEAHAIKLLDNQCHIFARASRGKFGIAPFIVIDAMNFVAEMRGMTRAFEDVIDHPDETQRLMDFAFELNVFIQSRVHGMIDQFMGGSFVNMGSWAPGTPVLISVDAYHLAGPSFYYEWGEPHIRKMLDHFGGGLLHVHSNGRHLLPDVSKLKNLLSIYLLDEDWNPRAYDDLGRYQAQVGDLPLVISCGYDEFVRDLSSQKLPGNVLYDVRDVPSIADANRLMERVRKYRR